MNVLKFLCVLVSVVVTFIPNQAGALTSNQVEEIARQISVKIMIPNIRNPAENEFIGTGVIITSPSDTNTYYVLTAKHIASASKETKYILVTPDVNSYEVSQEDIRDLPNMDLSLLKFVSYKTYQQARLGESERLKLEDNIYIYGWEMSEIREKFVAGRFRQHMKQENSSGSSYRGVTDGYGITYDAQTENGMSGGPVLDKDGRLVGIHGRATPFYKLGIPIETFLNSTYSGLSWLRICNRMEPQNEIFIALVRYVGLTGWESGGWYKTESNSCLTFPLGEEYRRNVYYYAESGEISWGSGSRLFCINQTERFTIQNSDNDQCDGNNLKRVGMTEIQVAPGMRTIDLTR